MSAPSSGPPTARSVAPRLRFGIPSLDAMFVGDPGGTRDSYKNLNWGGLTAPDGQSTSFCLIGPDGTGKSVFALHFAARYLKDYSEYPCRKCSTMTSPKVLYISTDLQHGMALRMAKDFNLLNDGELLIDLKTTAYEKVADYLIDSEGRAAFIDLASDSAGDDWALAARLVSLLRAPCCTSAPRHLLIVDAMEGLETLAGETDAYGQKVSRRARIAFLMRLASKKCHLGLIVEETRDGQKLPEEFVADSVIRLRSTLTNGYTRRTLEIEKSRGQALVARGQHPFHIFTVDRKHRDEGVVIYPSLHYRGNVPAPTDLPDTVALVGFGIPHLDSMLYKNGEKYGFRGGRCFSLVGDTGTSKSLLAHGFLAQAVRRGENGVAVLISSRPMTERELKASLERQLAQSDAPVEGHIILKTVRAYDQSAARLISRLEATLDEAKTKLGQELPHKIRVVFDDVTAFRDAHPEIANDPLFLPALIGLLRSRGVSALIVANQSGRPGAQQIDKFDSELRSLCEGHLLTWRVPFLGDTRTAITFVSAYAGDRHSQVREVVSTWLDSPVASSNPVVKVTRDFEMYEGLERGEPEPVPLEIRLYAETPAVEGYIEQENKLFCQLFPANPQIISSLGRSDYDALRDYCYLSASTQLPKTLILQIDEFWQPAQGKTMLANLRSYLEAELTYNSDQDEDHYEVFRRSKGATSVSAADLGSRTPKIYEYPQKVTRKDTFPLFRRSRRFETDNIKAIDRVPFTWDFGFLLLSHHIWYAAQNQELPRFRNLVGKPVSVAAVLDALRKPVDCLPLDKRSLGSMKSALRQSDGLVRGPGSWRAFAEACVEITRMQTTPGATSIRPFDLARPAGESFSCLIKEIWFSEILEQFGALIRQEKDKDKAADIRCQAHKFLSDFRDDQLSLQDLLRLYSRELYMVWMILLELIDLDSLVEHGSPFAFKAEGGAMPALATRHWYKTACEAQSARDGEAPDATLPVRLPGYFSTRGDWYLAMAGGSRSHRLGTRALDILSSRRASIARLQQGIGLPVRDIAHPAGADKFRTRLAFISGHNRPATLGYADMIRLGADDTFAYFADFKDKWPQQSDSSWQDPDNPIGHSTFLDRHDIERGFFWLRRSRIKGYDRESRVWQKWLVRMALALKSIRANESHNWSNGLDVYDDIARHVVEKIPEGFGSVGNPGVPGHVADLPTYQRFERLVGFLGLELLWQDTHG